MNNNNSAPANKRFYFEWLIPYLLHPRSLAQQIAQKRATWWTPLLVVSILMVVRLWLAVPSANAVPIEAKPEFLPGAKGSLTETFVISSKAGGGGGGGGGGEVVPPGGSESVQQGVSPAGNIVPMLTSVAGLWIGWFLLSVLLYVGMVVSGSSNGFTETLNLVAWSSLPLGIRQFPLLIASLAIPSVAANTPGLSSLTSAMPGPTGMFLTSLLKMLDVYLVWQVVLILLGLGQISPLPAKRAVGVTLGAVALFLVLAAVPGFLSVIFTQLTQPLPGTYY